MSLLSVSGVSCSIAERPILSSFNFELNQGEYWGVLGANGIGKTTLLMTLAGLRQANEGSIRIGDKTLEQWPRKLLARQLGLLLQDSHDAFPASVIETTLSGRYPWLPMFGLESEVDLDMAREALHQVSMQGLEKPGGGHTVGR